LERINQFALYELARELRQLGDVVSDVPMGELLYRTRRAQAAIDPYLSEVPPLRLSFALAALRDLAEEVQKLQKKTDTFGLAFVLANKDGEPMVEGWHFLGVRHALMKFEAVLSAECARNPVFVAPKRGAFDTDDLVNMAREMIPAALRPAISNRALDDLDSAGRCLAFGLFTASGFHACRAVESVMEDYYRRFLRFDQNATKLA